MSNSSSALTAGNLSLPICFPRVIGHRGIASLAPENTLGAMRKAAASGVSWVEIDVTLLGDGTAVICHDANLRRLARRRLKLSELNAAQTPALNMAAHFDGWQVVEPLPTLTQMLRLLSELGMGLNLEIKDHGLDSGVVVAKIAPLLADFDSQQLLISSFSEALLAQCQAQMPQYARGLLTERLPRDWPQRMERLGALSLHPRWRDVTPELIAEVHACGYALLCWTLDDVSQGERLLAQGLDALISNTPQQFRHELLGR